MFQKALGEKSGYWKWEQDVIDTMAAEGLTLTEALKRIGVPFPVDTYKGRDLLGRLKK